jgi:outer membrane protein TolC
MNCKHHFRSSVIACLGLCGFMTVAFGADTVKLTVSEAVQLALRQNRVLKIARLKVAEYEQKKAGAKSDYFPAIKNQSSVVRITALENIIIPTGAFGVIPNIGPLPDRGILITQGSQTFETSGTMMVQPLTQLIRIRQANRIAASEIAASRDELKKAEDEVALQVHALYYGILITRLQKKAAEQESVYAGTRLRESEEDVRNGSALRISSIEGRAGLLETEQAVLSATLRLSDLRTELNDLLGLPLDTVLELSAVETAILKEEPREAYLKTAFAENPQIQGAMEVVHQAKAGVTAAKSAYIPDVSVFARQSYQNGVPFLVHNFGTFGVNFSYDVFDFGKRRAVVREREARLTQAEENLERLKQAVSVQIERSYNKTEQTRNMLKVATEVVRLRAEGERLAENQMAQGVVLVSARRQASAAIYKAQADLLHAQLAHLLAWAELEQTAGRTPGL